MEKSLKSVKPHDQKAFDHLRERGIGYVPALDP